MLKKYMIVLCLSFTVIYSVFAQPALYSNTFPLSDITLTEGPFKHAMDLNIQTLLEYDTDRLLAPYLKEAGLTPKGESFSNWIGLDGHIGGHYLSALAIHYAASGNTQCKERMDYMLSELKKCQQEYNDDPVLQGYLGGVPDGRDIWVRIKNGDVGAVWDGWVPWYNVHKMYAGLRDAWVYGGSEDAREMFLELCDWGIELCAGLSDNQFESMLGNEHGGINEVYADAYQMTNDIKYLTMAKKLSHKTILNPMSSGVDNLDNMHANTQVPKAVGFQRIAEVSDDNTYSGAAEFFWETVTQNRSLAFGGNSREEHFPAASDCIDYINVREGPESCNSYNMLKLSEGLFRMDPDASYADFYERTMFNHILSTQHPDHGGYVYFTPARPRHYRVYSAPNSAMWCCVGTGMENHGKYGQFIYTHTSDSLFVNLFVASELDWKEKGVQITQETLFPDEEQTELTISAETPTRFNLLIRHPSWVPSGALKIIEGSDTLSSQSQPSTYVELSRTWSSGDALTVLLPMHTAAEKMPNVDSYAALMHGPVLLGAETSTSDMPGLIADGSRWGHIAHGSLFPLDEAPVIAADRESIPDKLVPQEGPEMSFAAPGLFDNWTGRELTLKPFFRIHDARYMVYWMISDSGYQGEDEEEELLLDARTIDKVAPGEQQPEVDHNIQTLNSETGVYDGEFYRDAGSCSGGDGGFISYTLLTNRETDLSLMVKYWGNEGCTRTFDILIDGEKLVTENIVDKWNVDEFVNVEYPVSNSMVEGKDTIVVRFEASSGMVGGLYDIRLLRDEETENRHAVKETEKSAWSLTCLQDKKILFNFPKRDLSRYITMYSISGKIISSVSAPDKSVYWDFSSGENTSLSQGIYVIEVKTSTKRSSRTLLVH